MEVTSDRYDMEVIITNHSLNQQKVSYFNYI